tara:strand:- start:333 stop:836 length:504 start_codon:yes stop_codon:yes gene_type:complete
MAQYIFQTTGLPYSGNVVDVGGDLFSTDGVTLEGFSQKVILDSTDEVVNQEKKDIITTFVVGDGSKYGKFRFFGDKNNANTEIGNGTPLHHHTVPATGDNNFMTQHDMNGAVNVYSQNQVNFNITNTSTPGGISETSTGTPPPRQEITPPNTGNDRMNNNIGGGGTY